MGRKQSGSIRSRRCDVSPSWGGWGEEESSDKRVVSCAGVVCDMIPASQVRSVSGDLCNAAPPLEAWRIMAWTSWTVALCFYDVSSVCKACSRNVGT